MSEVLCRQKNAEEPDCLLTHFYLEIFNYVCIIVFFVMVFWQAVGNLISVSETSSLSNQLFQNAQVGNDPQPEYQQFQNQLKFLSFRLSQYNKSLLTYSLYSTVNSRLSRLITSCTQGTEVIVKKTSCSYLWYIATYVFQ